MATELDETSLISKLADIDSEIATITDTLGTSGTGGVQYTDYSIGNKSVSGSKRLELLIKIREHYQGLLEKVPKIIRRDTGYEIEDRTGAPLYQQIGDE